MFQVVGKVGPKEVVLGRQQAFGEAVRSTKDRRRQRVKPRHEQVLGIVPLILAVETAHEPRQPISAAGESHLLRPHLGVGGIVERRIERINVLREADGPAGDAGSQGGRIAHDQDLAMRVRCDRGQARLSQVVRQIQVGEQEVVGEGLVDLGEHLALAQGHRGPGGGVRIGQDVEGINAVPAVHLHPLIDDPRDNAQA